MKNKTVLVTGASGGIGQATVYAFLEQGCTVIGTYCRNEKAAAELIRRAQADGYYLHMCRADLSRSEEVARLYNEVRSVAARVDILVNNAGIARPKLFTDLTDEDWRTMLDTNLSSVFYTCRAFLPDMISAKYGRIINVSSIWGVVGGSCEVDYSAAKAGVIGLTKALAKEAGLSGVTVNAVAPGATATVMLAGYSAAELADIANESALGKIVTPQAVASAIVYLASEEAGFITGEVINVNAGR